MCTRINETTPVAGSAKGASGWWSIENVNVGYDHPIHAIDEHAVLIDFTSEGQRLAVELSRESARRFAGRLLAAIEQADAYETQAASA